MARDLRVEILHSLCESRRFRERHLPGETCLPSTLFGESTTPPHEAQPASELRSPPRPRPAVPGDYAARQFDGAAAPKSSSLRPPARAQTTNLKGKQRRAFGIT